jgi:RNA polymerase sigma-70 factor (ECF subfamily)
MSTMASFDFSKAYRNELRPVCAFLRRLGVRDFEDVAHDTFVVAFTRVQEFDVDRPLRPWLLGIAVRVWRGRQNSASSRREVGGWSPDVADERSLPDESMVAAQRRALLARALQSLDEDQRLAFVWHDIEERPVAELAETLSVPANTIYSRLRLARRKVQASFSDLLAEEKV